MWPLKPLLLGGVAALAIAGCGAGHRSGAGDDASNGTHGDGRLVDSRIVDGHAQGDGARPGDAASSGHDAHNSAGPDAFPSTLDLRIDCHNDCTLTSQPPSIAVTPGTGFQVNWINVGDTPCDVAKIDQFNQVPIVLGLDPGTSYDDTVHEWCGSLFTGTFEFQISICTLPSDIPVNCGA